MKALEFIDRFIFETYGPCVKNLPVFRILFATFLIVFYLPAYSWLAWMPNSFFHPQVSLAMLFGRLPPGWFFYALDIFLEFGALCLLFGWKTRPASFALCAGIIIGNSFRYSIGPKIDHDILIPATLFCLGFSSWGDHFSHDEQNSSRMAWKNSANWPVALLMLIVGTCMLTAAVPKALSGWANPHVLACRGQMIANYLQHDRPTALADALLRIPSPIFWKMADWSTLAVEGGFIFCAFSLPTMRLIAALAVFFHAFVYFSMSIFFVVNLAAYACLINYSLLLRNSRVRHLVRLFRRLSHRITLAHLIPLTAGVLGVALTCRWFEFDFSPVIDPLILIIALVIAVTYLLSFFAFLADRFVLGMAFPLDSKHSLCILYDGECGLCDRWVQFVLEHDRQRIFRFAPLQSGQGKALLKQTGSPESDLKSMVLVVNNKAYFRSTGIIMILRQLGEAKGLLGGFAFVPAPVRDFAYATVAANRHRWFPKSGSSCRLLRPDEQQRFLA